ncbi:protein GRAVITROPIC IN THE LIGHT 1-like [Actinidia eriantha]|uniref:protein GRAVITROPIC IN THE LIGHT 1-like n=1 Tax=Actinidia eriantha TaxID=165200 RepID=UPI00258EBA89|nr:protein GRAVITROPIC IN THE LIGHT 1-like [Actinidia eriantha]
MFPTTLFRSFRSDNSSGKKKNRIYVETEWADPQQLRFSVPFNRGPIPMPLQQTTKFPLRAHTPSNNRTGEIKPKKMSTRISNFSDLIQRVTASCLLHRRDADDISVNCAGNESDDERYESEDEEDDEDEEREKVRVWGGAAEDDSRVVEMAMLVGEVFDAVKEVKAAYVSLQEAHCPWDPDKMRLADVAVVAELRRLGVLRERFRRSVGRECSGGGGRRLGATLREVVAPYEAAVEELKREVKAKEAEVENLREKLKTATSLNCGSGGKKGRSRKVSCSQAHVAAAPAPEIFEATMSTVIEASKSFTALLLSLMRSAHWDITAAVRSIEAATTTDPTSVAGGSQHAKYALESYVSRKIFQGFDHETFYMDGSLSSLLHPDQFRRDCFSHYRDTKAMDPIELLGILPTCQFGKFCSKKYLAIVHPKMEESLFGDLEQRRQVLAGNHPRSQFYGEFLRLAKAVWLLHLLAFALEPPPSHFEASRGAEFHPQYMESVVRFPGGRGGEGQVVGFAMSPGFKLVNGSVIKARVYLVPRT